MPSLLASVTARGRLYLVLGVIFFFVPVALWAVGVQSTTTEKRRLAPFPSSVTSWDLMNEIAAYANDHVPFRGDAIRAQAEISHGIFHELPASANGNATVTLGTDNWLYLASELQRECNVQDRATVVDGLRRFQQLLAASGRTLVLTVAPDKSTAEPEHVVPGGPLAACSAASKRATFDALTQGEITGYVNMRALIQQHEAAEDRDYYFRQDTHWNGLADALFAQQAAAIVDPALANGTKVQERTIKYTGDLTELLGDPSEDTGTAARVVRNGVTVRTSDVPSNATGAPPSIRSTATSTAAPLYPGQALIIGDSFSSRVLPKLQPYFASTLWVHSIAAYAHQAELVQDIVSSRVVIWVLAERYWTDSTLGTVWTPQFLQMLQSALTPVASGG